MTYSSKLIEWVVCNQLISIAVQSGNVEGLHSAHRKHHSMETAVLKVKSGLLTAMDNKEVTCFMLLDLSAAFDTVNHKSIFNRLKHRIDIEMVHSSADRIISHKSYPKHQSG